MKQYQLLLAIVVISLSLIMEAEVARSDEQPVEQPVAESADAAAKELANPAGSLASLNVSFQYTEYTGDLPNSDDQDAWSIKFQPTLPFPVGEKGRNIIFRPAVTLLFDQPIFEPEKADFDDLDTNLGDIGFDMVYAGNTMKSKNEGFLWGFGTAGTFPTATDDDVGGDQWRLGPEFFGGVIRKWGIAGALVNNQWDMGGSNDSSYSTLTAQYFYAIGLGNGWQLTSSPNIIYDWKADSDDALTLPLGVGVAKTTKIGTQTWKFKLEVQKYVVQPDAFGSDWLVKLTITPVINNPFVFYR